ncbi:MAG TPA: glycosyltransferase [Hyphomicrobiales bacterium]|nr:glycosyltransferase [Hyphomicrobiales bacterium]
MTRRLLFYTHALVDGGAERVSAVLASRLAAAGDDVVFVVDRAAGGNGPDLDPAVRLVVLSGGHAGNVLALARLLWRERPQVAFSAAGGSNPKLALARLLAPVSGIRLVPTYHGFEDWKTGLLGNLAYRLAPLIARLSARVVAVSDALADALVAEWGVPRARIARIQNPVETAPHPASATEIAGRPPIVLGIGRLSAEKDFVSLVRAFAAVTTPDARLVLVGDGPERGAIAAEIDRLGLSDRATLAGYVKDPTPFYGAARCLALASRTESFGNVVVEALSHGLPVVATATAGPVEILAGGRHGRLVPVGDVDALAGAIEAALADPGDPETRAARAAEFSLEAGVAAYSRLIDEIIDGARPRPAQDASVLRSGRVEGGR